MWGKSEKIKRTNLICPKEEGGIDKIDMLTKFESLKATWIPRLLDDKGQEHWKELPAKYLSAFGPDNIILKCYINKIENCPILKSIPKLYQKVILSFLKSKEI